MTTASDASGAAALAICESLLLTLTDLKIISAQDVRGLLSDVLATHQAAALDSECSEHDRTVAAIAKGLLDRHPLQV